MKNSKKIGIIVCFVFVVMFLGISCFTSEKPLEKQTNRIAILGYHHLVKDHYKYQDYLFDPWTASVSSFQRQMKYLYDHGYHTISLDELYEWYEGKKELDNKAIVLTFDDSYYSTDVLAKPILKKYGFQATTFVIGKSIPKQDYEYQEPLKTHIPLTLLKDDSIMKYYSHFHHLHRKVDGQYAIDTYTKKQIKEDIQLAQKAVSTDYMAYPFGKCNEISKQALKEMKVKLGFRYHQYHKMNRKDDPYELPRFSINAYTPMFLFRWYLNQ